MDKFKSLRRTGLKTVADSTSHSLSRLKFNEKELSKIATVCIPDKEGLVEKKGPGKGQGYKPRWLRLKGNLLFYFKLLESGDVDSNGPAGLLILESCCPERTHKDDKPFAFTISFTNDKSRVYKFSAHSEQDANSWVEVLRNASYEQLRMRVYHLQKEISKRTGMDPLIGLASKVKRQKSTLLRSTRMKSSSTVRVFRPVDAHRTPFSFSSLDAPLFEVHLSCRGLPLSPTGSPPSTLIRSSISLGPGGTTKALCETEIVEESCNPMFFSVVMLEVTREAARCGVVRFELESVTSDTTDTCSIAPTQDNSEPEVCLLAALVGYGEVPLESLLNYPATSDCGIVDVPLSSSSGAGVGVLTVQIRKAKEVMEYCDQNMRTRRSTIVKRADTVQGLQLPVKNIHFCPFQFPTNHHTTLKVLEELSESVFNLQVPLQLLKCYIKEDRQRIKDISELGQLGLGWASTIESFKTLLVESVQEYQQSVDRMNTALLQDECNFKSSTEKKERDLQFVPCNLHIQVLRVSECSGSGHFSEQNGSGQFSEHKGSTNVSGQPPKENCYVTVTFGAASDHVSGFKHGGVKALLKEARNQPSFISGCHKYGEILFQLGKIRENIYDYKNFLFRAAANQNSEEMSDAMQGISNGIQLLLQMLQNSVVDKAIQDLRSARTNHLRSSTPLSPPAFSKCQCKFTSTNDWVWNGKRFIQVSTDWEGSVAVQSVNKYLIKLLETVEKGSRLIVELRHEAHASSINQLQIRYKPSYCWSYALLSAFRKLNQTLEGIFTVVESSVCFAMVQSDSRVQSVKEIRHRRDVVFSQILTALMTGFYQSLSEHLKDGQFLEQMKKLGYLAHFQSFLSDQGDEASMLEDMHIAVLELRTVSFQILPCQNQDSSSVDFSIFGTRNSLTIQLLFPLSLLSLIPDVDIASGHPIQVVPILFTQGINERQTIANLTSPFVSATEEDNINSSSLRTLEEYISSYVSLIGESHPDSVRFREKFDTLRKSHSKVKSKNVEFMMEAEMLCRAVNGGRFTSCKSAKDRTGMAVTLEEVNLLSHKHSLDESSMMTALGALRSQGTRLYNCYKNTGRYRYAFNVWTSKMFPKLYQPPSHTCSNVSD